MNKTGIFGSHMDYLLVPATFNYFEKLYFDLSNTIGYMNTRNAFTIFRFCCRKMNFRSNFLMVNIIDQDLNRKGPQKLLLAVVNCPAS